MACKLIWSPSARDDLRDIVRFIARDSRARAEAFGFRMIQSVEGLQEFPEMGRVVPEYGMGEIRELIIRSYRIVYRVDHSRRTVEIARVWHAARGTPELGPATGD